MPPPDTRRAFFWGHLSVGLAGTALALLSVALVLPWVSIATSGASAAAAATLTQSYFIIGIVILTCTGACGITGGGGSGIWLWYVGAQTLAAAPEVRAFYQGLAAGLGLVSLAHMLAIAGVCLASRAFRLLRGGRAACCAGCICTGCSCCCGGGVPPPHDAARLARARCSAQAALGLLIATAVAAAAAAAAVGIGSRGIIANIFTGYAVTMGGMGLTAFACVVAAAAAGAAGVFIRLVSLDDVKGGGNGLTNTVVINALQMHALPTQEMQYVGATLNV